MDIAVILSMVWIQVSSLVSAIFAWDGIGPAFGGAAGSGAVLYFLELRKDHKELGETLVQPLIDNLNYQHSRAFSHKFYYFGKAFYETYVGNSVRFRLHHETRQLVSHFYEHDMHDLITLYGGLEDFSRKEITKEFDLHVKGRDIGPAESDLIEKYSRALIVCALDRIAQPKHGLDGESYSKIMVDFPRFVNITGLKVKNPNELISKTVKLIKDLNQVKNYLEHRTFVLKRSLDLIRLLESELKIVKIQRHRNLKSLRPVVI